MPDNSFIPLQGEMRQRIFQPADLGISAATALGANATAAGTVVATLGDRGVAVSGGGSQPGNLILQMYLDTAGTVPGEQIVQSFTAGGTATCYSTVGRPNAAFKVSIQNTNNTAGTCQAYLGLTQA